MYAKCPQNDARMLTHCPKGPILHGEHLELLPIIKPHHSLCASIFTLLFLLDSPALCGLLPRPLPRLRPPSHTHSTQHNNAVHTCTTTVNQTTSVHSTCPRFKTATRLPLLHPSFCFKLTLDDSRTRWRPGRVPHGIDRHFKLSVRARRAHSQSWCI
jgi:hypothetical protein